jgi:cation:H+ antiporter
MTIALYILYITIGLAGLAYSADKFVDGASNISLNLKISPIVVGIIVVGIGTSAPEMLVSASAALDGKSSLALGNAIGSNIANIAFIIGFSALLMSIKVSRTMIKKEFMLMIGTTFLGAYLLSDGFLSRMDGIILAISLIFIMYFLIYNAKHAQHPEGTETEELPQVATMTFKKSIIFTIVGMIALVAFSQLLVFGAVELATLFGVSELVIGLTIIAVGTSLPELSASIAAVRKNSPDLAIGNILGSNIFNIAAVLSIASVIAPFEVSEDVINRDIPLLIALTIGFLLISFAPKGDGKINRIEGVLLLTIYVSYLTILVCQATGIFDLNQFLFQ